MAVYVGIVPTFKDVQPNKQQAVKVLEEAAELFGAWQIWQDGGGHYERERVLEECTDVIQATCNLFQAVTGGYVSLSPYVAECRKRNEMRNRIYEDAANNAPSVVNDTVTG